MNDTERAVVGGFLKGIGAALVIAAISMTLVWLMSAPWPRSQPGTAVPVWSDLNDMPLGCAPNWKCNGYGERADPRCCP